MIRLDLNKIEHIKLQIKLALRKLFPSWFLSLMRRRQVSLKKMQNFLKTHQRQPTENSGINDITIVVPCYNHSQYLKKTFESIVNQTRMPEAVIFIDDHSTDNTKNVLKDLLSEYQRSRGTTHITAFSIVTNDKNIGQAMTINKGVSIAQTDLIMILNDDDYLMHDVVELTFDIYNQNKEIRLLGGGCIQFSDNTTLEKTNKQSRSYIGETRFKVEIKYPKEAISYEDYCSINMTHSGSSFYRTCAQQVGLYWPKKDRLVPFSDRDFQIRMNLLYPIALANDRPFCLWRSNSSVDSGKNS